MGLLSRVAILFRVRTSAALDRAEDPRQVLDYAYQQQQEMLVALKRGLVDVATSKQQLLRQVAQIRERAPRLEEQAASALGQGREDLARIVLERKHAALAELEGLERQQHEVQEEETRLAAACQQLTARIDEFRVHREVVRARYTAAAAKVRVSEAVAGISGDLAELGMAVGRAEEKADRMLSRAAALDSLVGDGRLGLQFGDAVEQELKQLAAGRAAEEELTALRARLLPTTTKEVLS